MSNSLSAPTQGVMTPVHLLAGFLGTGKTTTLLQLLAQRPTTEKWAVIVNEFGEIGIDGVVLQQQDIEVREISGGCLCCTTGPQLPVTVTRLLRDYEPDRLFIETSGLAHLATLVDQLKRPPLGNALAMQAVITLVDVRQFFDSQYRDHPVYRDQIQIADVLVASKTDLASPEQLSAFEQEAAAMFPPKQAILNIQHGDLGAEVLTMHTASPAPSRYRPKLPGADNDISSCGWRFPAQQRFDADRVARLFDQLPHLVTGLWRAKAVLYVHQQRLWFNWSAGQWGVESVAWRGESRFELICRQAQDFSDLEAALYACLVTDY